MAAPNLSRIDAVVNRNSVLATYRHLLRATRIAFIGDNQTLIAARAYAKSEFDRHRGLENGSIEAAQAVEHAQGVTKILREHVVQGKNMGGEKYKLNIHEHTQKLDNETAGQLKGTTKSFKEVKDAVF